MTVIKGIELDDFKYKKNELKLVIQNNDPIEDKLHVIAVISNPCLYVTRYILFKEFIQRIENEERNVILYIVELTYGDQKFIMTDSKNPRHLQINTKIPLWHKENMINMGVKKLLPRNWKAFAWIDADLEFESSTWALDGLYDKSILGSGDNIMMLALLGNALKAITSESTDGYKKSVIEYEEKISTLRFGYVPGMIYHYFHGSKKNRQYTERWKILSENNFDPFTFIEYDKNGIIVPTSIFPETLVSGIMTYFEERNEDEFI